MSDAARSLLLEKVRLQEALMRRRAGMRLQTYQPYPKQRIFHAAGRIYRERLFKAGNQLGKTLAGAAETSMHLTGQYPPDWNGRKWNRQVRVLVGSETGTLTRDGVQRLLLGDPQDRSSWGTGYIPRDSIVGEPKMKAGVPDAVESISVKHASGGSSTLIFKSYDQGRARWQADTVDIVWFDEEPPPDIYSEGLTRTNATNGMVFLTFTPLQGMSTVVVRFLKPDPLDAGAADRHVTTMTIFEAEHYSPEQRARIIAGYPAHEREARANGVPLQGSGRVFPIDRRAFEYDPEEFHPLPSWYHHVIGLDFGWDHPTASVWMAYDPDGDVLWVHNALRMSNATPLVFAGAMRSTGPVWMPVAWPHDGLQHDKGSGEQLAGQYAKQGLRMIAERATFEDGTNGLEAGVQEMYDRMITRRLRVASHLADWWEEFMLYHRKDGKIVKEVDDLLSATRYGMMMRRFAIPNGRTTLSFEPGATTGPTSTGPSSFEP